MQLTDLKEDRLKKTIESLAKNVEVVDNFDDVRVINKRDKKTLAWTDIEDKTVYINTSSPLLEDEELVAHLDGILVHEGGHLDGRLKVPHDMEKSERDEEQLDRGKKLLNFLYDIEIHYQYNLKGRIRPKFQLRLKKFLTLFRNKLLDTGDKDNLMLSMIDPQTEKQRKIRSIVSNRNMTIVDKARAIVDLLDEDDMKKRGMPDMEQGETGEEDEKQQEQEEKETEEGDIDEFTELGKPDEDEESEESEEEGGKEGKPGKSVKKEAKKAKEKKDLKKKLIRYGFSDQRLENYMDKKETDEAVKNIRNLADSLEDILPFTDKMQSTSKTTLKQSGDGFRFNGYRKPRSFDELMTNIEDLMSVGKYDPQDVKVSRHVSRRNKGIVLILRDVSGSMSKMPKCKQARDITVSLVKKVMQENHRVGVTDFHSFPEPIEDSEGKVLTEEYDYLLLDSMKIKEGGSTRLSAALEYVNEIIDDYELDETPINIYIVSDSRVNRCSGVNFDTKSSVNINGIWLKNWKALGSNFKSLVERYNGKIYQVTEDMGELISELYKDF